MSTKTTLYNDFIQYAIDGLDNGHDGVYASDLHNQLFNMDYFIIGTYEAKKWLEENPGVFEAIQEIKEYEQSNFGTVSTDLSDPEKVVNMFAYIQGELILAESKTLQNKWDGRLTSEDIEAIKEELKELL